MTILLDQFKEVIGSELEFIQAAMYNEEITNCMIMV